MGWFWAGEVMKPKPGLITDFWTDPVSLNYRLDYKLGYKRICIARLTFELVAK